MPHHAHMLFSIPPKYAVSQVVGFIKGESAFHLAKVYGERKRNFVRATLLGPESLSRTRPGATRTQSRLLPQSAEEDQRPEQIDLWR